MAAQLQHKVAIVTGSSSGIGEAVALLFASRGAKLTLCGRDQERLNSVLDKVVRASGGHSDRFITVVGELNDQAVRKATVDKTVEKFGGLDILVANAGATSPNQTVHDATEKSYDNIMNTNLKSVFFLIQQAVPHLEKSKGNIISTSSNLTAMVAPLITIYSMSKAALNHLTSCLAVDLGAKGIRVNSVLPGYIPTRIVRSFGENMDTIQSSLAKMEATQQPLKDRVLTVNDIAETVAFLASDAAGCITGEHVIVDGARRYGGLHGGLANLTI